LSLEDTAKIIGRSVVWTCRLRNRFFAGETVGDGQRQQRGGRRRQNLSIERESEVLSPLLERARDGGILEVPRIKAELEAALGRRMALSSVYNLLHRHGWRKLAARALALGAVVGQGTELRQPHHQRALGDGGHPAVIPRCLQGSPVPCPRQCVLRMVRAEGAPYEMADPG
jgi:transposase